MISDVGSGINCKRKGLLELLKRIEQNEMGKRAHKARRLIKELVGGERNDEVV